MWGNQKKKEKNPLSKEDRHLSDLVIFQKLVDCLPHCRTAIWFLPCCAAGYITSIYSFFFFPLLKVMMTTCSYRSILCMTQNSPYMGTYCTSTVESLYYIFVPCQLCYQCKINGFWHTAAQHVNSGSNTAVKGFVYWYTRIWWQR